jgi:lipoyl(octanoyl) transferase
MSRSSQPATPASPALSAHLLGAVDFEACLALQQRLVYEATGRSDGHITLLICEHPQCITVGRQGSRGDIKFEPGEAGQRELAVRWVNRGGPALLHAPGQLAIYPIVPLEHYGWSVGDYLERLEAGLLAALVEGGFQAQREAGHRGVWGRSGQLVALGVAVKSWVSYFGAYLNVSPPISLVRRINSDLRKRGPMSSLVVERSQIVRMAGVRERVVRRLAEAFDSPRYHIHAGHPLLTRRTSTTPQTTARAG